MLFTSLSPSSMTGVSGYRSRYRTHDLKLNFQFRDNLEIFIFAISRSLGIHAVWRGCSGAPSYKINDARTSHTNPIESNFDFIFQDLCARIKIAETKMGNRERGREGGRNEMRQRIVVSRIQSFTRMRV